jgi:hypothetical protein
MAYFPSIAIGVPFFRSFAGFSQEALDWQARIIANGGTIPDATLAIFDNNFFKPAKANGNILTEADRINVYFGLLGYPIAARTNLIKSAHFVSPVSSPVFDINGYKSGGTSYLNLNYNPSTQGVKYTQNSAIMFYGVKEPAFATTIRAMGARDGTRFAEMYRLAGPGRSYVQLNDNGIGGPSNTNTSSTGYVFLGARRPNSANLENIINTNVATIAKDSNGLPNTDLFELGISISGSVSSTLDDKYHGYSGNGSANFDYAGFQTIMNNLKTALGV